MKIKDPTTSKESKMTSVAATLVDTVARQKRQMDYEKERKELFFKQAAQVHYYSLTVYTCVHKAVGIIMYAV